MSEALECSTCTTKQFCGLQLIRNAKLKRINPTQFLQSVVNSMQSRMTGAIFTNIQLLDDMKVFVKANWPENIDQDIRYGEKNKTA